MQFKRLGRLFATVALAAATCLPLAAHAFSSLVIFGDSLSDDGNNAAKLGIGAHQVITGNTYIPTRPYASGTYSNGPVWVTSFAAGLGLNASYSLGGGTDFAYGGAVTSGTVVYPPTLQKQLTLYLNTAPSDEASALYVIAGGGNNAFDALDAISGGADPTATIAAAASQFAADVGGMVDTLQAAGAQRIVVWDTPDVGSTPFALASGESALGTQVATAMNQALQMRLVGEHGVSTFDVFGLVGTAAGRGLANVTDACGAIAGCDPSTYLFWDGIHPTSAGHAIIADAMLAAVPEPGTLAMFALGIAAIGLRRRSLR